MALELPPAPRPPTLLNQPDSHLFVHRSISGSDHTAQTNNYKQHIFHNPYKIPSIKIKCEMWEKKKQKRQPQIIKIYNTENQFNTLPVESFNKT